MEQIEECSQIKNNSIRLIEYLKTANASVLAECYALDSPLKFRSIWVPTVEKSSVVGAFLTETPEKIYNSNKAPAMDAMFSMTTTVIILNNEKKNVWNFKINE